VRTERWRHARDTATDLVTQHALNELYKLSPAHVSVVGDTVQRKWSRVEYEALRRPMYREAEDMSAVVDKWPKATATFALVARQSGQVFEAELYQEAASTGAPVANFDYVRGATFRFDSVDTPRNQTPPVAGVICQAAQSQRWQPT
jgi:hypothetical protein